MCPFLPLSPYRKKAGGEMHRYLFLWLSLALLGGEGFVGIGHEEPSDPAGIKVTRIVDDSPADIAGLLVGDIVTEIDGSPVKGREGLSQLLEERNPGDLLKLSVRRCESEITLRLILGNRQDYIGNMRKGGRESFPTDASELYPGWDGNEISQLILETIEAKKMNTGYKLLSDAFKAELESYRGHYTLDCIALGLIEPASVYSSYDRVRELLSFDRGGFDDLAGGISAVLDCGDTSRFDQRRAAAKVPFTGSGLGTLQNIVIDANKGYADFLSPLSQDEIDNIEDAAPFLMDIFSKTVYISDDPDEELVEAYENMLESSKKLDFGLLFDAGQLLSSLMNSAFLDSLRDFNSESLSDNDMLVDSIIKVGEYVDSTDNLVDIMGRLVITGTGSGFYSEEAAIWIDLGGDDTYLGFGGGTPHTIFDNYHHNFQQGRVGVHIDLGGNDRYIRNTIGALGSGYCGLGILIDAEGDDQYSGNRLSMGAGYFGAGYLVDLAGNDVYSGQEQVMGFGLFGSGMLFDSAGNDLYHAARYAQGVGVTKGLGLLSDINGNDKYIAAFKIPNGYGNENTWSGWSQGVGLGFRSFSAGGIGILSDRNGDDYYEAGNFSQACGYFFGFGIFDDMGGDDRVIGNRYVQGAGAHQAISLFRDRKGNDSYLGREAMNQGGAWDIQSSFFIDEAGNDSYVGQSYAQGGTAQTAFAFFLDGDGKDSYRSGSISNGEGGGLTYHPNYEARNLTISIDLGGDNDEYEMRKNNSFIAVDDDGKEETGDGIFRDE